MQINLVQKKFYSLTNCSTCQLLFHQVDKGRKAKGRLLSLQQLSKEIRQKFHSNYTLE